MRVLILHSRYLSGDSSGENRVVDDEAELLRRGGHDVHVWQPTPDVDSTVDRLRTAEDAIWARKASSHVRHLIRTHGAEIVHCHNLVPTLSPAVLRAATDAGAGVVTTLHNYRQMCLAATFLRDDRVCEDCLGRSPWPGVVHRCYRGSVLGSATLAVSTMLHRSIGTYDRPILYLAVSPFVRQKHVEAGVPADRIQVKSNFAWPMDVREGPGDYFLTLGRLSAEKGLASIVAAWRKSLGTLIVVGDGPEAARLRGLAGAGVEFLGAVPSAEVPALLGGARALLQPSVWYEAQPRVILEAYAAGIPVLASRIGGLSDLVEDDVSGFVLPVGDPDSWMAGVERLDEGEAVRLGEGAHRLWRDLYNPERGLRNLEEAYATARSLRQAHA
jgi:glycosyltransferase involved in cell wall biosynthesis